MDCFMLSANDGYAEAGSVSARHIADAWLALNAWPLYANTKNRKVIVAGASLVFYLGGHRTNRQTFIAKASVRAVQPAQRAETALSQSFFFPTPDKVLALSDLAYFPEPVSIRPLIGKLSVVRKTGPRWGAGLVGGSRRLTLEDFRLIERLGGLRSEGS